MSSHYVDITLVLCHHVAMPHDMHKKTRLTVYVTVGTYARLRKAAYVEERTFSELVNEALSLLFNNREKAKEKS